MTRLHRTALRLSEKIECAVRALTHQEEHGVITDLSREFDHSRPTVYEVKDTACEVLKAHFEKSELAGQPVCVMVDEAQLQRAIVALRAMSPNALRPIEDMLPIIYPGVKPSFGKIQSITARAEANARIFNAQADLSKIQAGALDELFSQGEPVLGGVDFASGYLSGLSLAMANLHTRLQALFPFYTPDAVCLACLILYLVGVVRKRPGEPWPVDERTRPLLGAFAWLKDRLGDKTDELLETVEALLEKHHRASSAIEGFNAALRPHLYVHKGVTQNFLELFRAYYNLRMRRSGCHKGTSPHQCLTGSPVNDWLSLIGFPPSSAATVH
jgi:hypothetical protein